jgi:hypothetical protein
MEGLISTAESWHLGEDRDEGPALSRITLETSPEEQAALHGQTFAQCFQTTLETDYLPLKDGPTGRMNAFSFAAFPSFYNKPLGSANVRDLLKDFYKLKSLQNKPDNVDPRSLDRPSVLIYQPPTVQFPHSFTDVAPGQNMVEGKGGSAFSYPSPTNCSAPPPDHEDQPGAVRAEGGDPEGPPAVQLRLWRAISNQIIWFMDGTK